TEWTLDQLAERLYRDKAYLNRRFKNVVGTSIWDYTIQKRINNAQRTLYRNGSIQEAFKASGFHDYSTFFRNYTKIAGITPSDDLRRHVAQKQTG
ncbi:MAG: helix-turn-helix domain-containing protein, partial [Eubacteriales bacterium]